VIDSFVLDLVKHFDDEILPLSGIPDLSPADLKPGDINFLVLVREEYPEETKIYTQKARLV
jgi:hypothetical protein